MTDAPLRCRTIQSDDIDRVVALLMRGFDDRTEAYWRDGLARHLARDLPENYPKLGFLLESGGDAVGVVLTLHTTVETPDGPAVRCNLSSWYVEPAFRPQATMLDNLAMRRKEVTYLNVTPAPRTWAMQEARGFRRYCRGQVLALPGLALPVAGVAARRVRSGDALTGLSEADAALVRDHLGYGCLCFVVADRGVSRPFMFLRRRIGLSQARIGRGPIPCLQLVYAGGDPRRALGAIGRRLLFTFEVPWMVIDAEGPLAGIPGRYFEGRAPKYAKGPHPPALGDLAYTELVLFGP